MTHERKTFEEYLQERFMSLREVGGQSITKDNFEDMFDNWLANLDGEEYMDWAESYGHQEYLQGQQQGLERAREILKA